MISLMTLIASVGGLLFGYETAGAAGALDDSDFPWGSADQVLSTATLLGAITGAVFVGMVADRVGRRDVIMVTSALFTTGAFVGALAPSIEVLFLGRVVVGVAVGAICVVSPVYIAEIAPKARRGGLICVFQLMITVGILAGFLVNEAIGGRPDSWRWILVGGAIPGLILSGLALFLVESPVWLALKGDQPAALAVLARLGRSESELEITSIRPEDEGRSGGLTHVFSLAGRSALFICVGLFFVQQFVGINAVIYYTTASIRRAIARAGRKAKVPDWSTMRLRHNAGTEAREELGRSCNPRISPKSDIGVLFNNIDPRLCISIVKEIAIPVDTERFRRLPFLAFPFKIGNHIGE
jgi:MFS family permease